MDAAGERIEGAWATWTPISTDLVAAARAGDWATVEAASSSSRSGALGELIFTAPPERRGDEPTVLWVTHPRFLAVPTLFGAHGRAYADTDPIVLERADPFLVTVVRDGARVAGAQVRQHGIDLALGGEPPRERLLQRAFELLVRTGETDSTGEVAMPPLAEVAEVRASEGRDVAVPYVGRTRGSPVLHLRPSFLAVGHVARADGIQSFPPLRVECIVVAGHLERRVASIVVPASGEWGPRRIPLLEADRYLFRLAGGNALPDDRTIEPPTPDEEVRVDLVAEPGFEAWCYVTDAEGELPPQTEVELVAQDEDGRAVRRTTRPFRDGEYHGLAQFRGVPRGSAVIEAHAPGYGRDSTELFGIPDEPPAARQLLLRPAGVVRGRVTYEGRPVPDFEIVYWRGPSQERPWRRTFHDRPAGTFALDDAPVGALTLFATSAEHARAAPVHLSVDGGATHDVDLELSRSGSAVGRVLDQATRQPIEGAEVRVWTSHLNQVLTPWGRPVESAADGTFEIEGLAPGSNKLRVAAPTYSSLILDATRVPGEKPHLPPVALCRAQPLEITLVGGHGADYATLVGTLRGTRDHFGIRFDANGRARVEAASAGRAHLTVSHPEGRLWELTTHLAPGRAWHLEVPLTGGESDVVVRVEDAEERPAPAHVNVRVHAALAPPTLSVASQLLGDDGEVHFGGLRAGPAALVVQDHARGMRLVRPLHLEPGSNSATVRLTAHVHRFEVLGPAGDPLGSAAVILDGALLAGADVRATTGPDGTCELRSLPPGNYLAHVSHPTHGTRTSIPITLPDQPAADPIELELHADEEVRVRLTDGSQPVGGARCELYVRDGLYFVGARVSDGEGLVRWGDLGDGAYRLRVDDAGHWPLDRTVSATKAGGGPTLLVARKRTHLLVHVVDEHSQPLPGIDVELQDLRSGETVADWLSGGLVGTSSGSLRSASDGTVRVTGLPAGTYRWRLPSAPDVRGDFDVTPGGSDDLVVRFPGAD